MFKLIAQPNDWEKTVRAATSHPEGGGVREELYRSFWAQWLKRVQNERPGWSRATQPPADSWFTMTAGTPGATFYTSFTRQGLSSELVFEHRDADINTSRLQQVQARQDELEQAYGAALDFQSLPNRKATRIAEYLPAATVTVQADWATYADWLMDRQTRLRAALKAVGGVPDGTAPLGFTTAETEPAPPAS